MPDFLAFTVDKFTFQVATDRLYTPAGVWVQANGAAITLGVSDFFQQHHGDVAFADVVPAGTAVAAGDTVATIETIKVDIDLACPISGVVTAVNDTVADAAEMINQDPYGAGWLAVIAASDWNREKTALLTPVAYFNHIQAQAAEETNTP